MGDKIFERLGVYDVLGVLLSGICMIGSTLFLGVRCKFFDECVLNINGWAFLIISYIFGLVFQESTHVIQNVINKFEDRKNVDKQNGEHSLYENNILLRKAVRAEQNHALYMEETEVENIKASISNIYGYFNWNIAYNHCRTYMSQKGSTARTDRDQALAAMARSLSFFSLLALCLPIFGLCNGADMCFCLTAIVSLSCLTVLFYHRFRRFTYRRYIAILRFFLYHQDVEKQTTQQNSKQTKQSGGKENETMS